MSAEPVAYLDSSAIVKLVVREDESPALLRHLSIRPVRASSALARVEVIRAVQTHGPAAVGRARQVLGAMRLLAIDQALLDAAAELPQTALRSLDAIHVASAIAIAEELCDLVTYDRRMAAAAHAAGLKVTSPAGS